MKRRAFRPHRVLMLLFAGALALAPAIATQSAWAKDEHKGKHENEKGGDGGKPSSRDEVRQGEYFDDRRRVVVHEYYGEQFRTGHCPPGLAKKHNGCMPPGQAKKWAIGRPLPRDDEGYLSLVDDEPARTAAARGEDRHPAGGVQVRTGGL